MPFFKKGNEHLKLFEKVISVGETFSYEGNFTRSCAINQTLIRWLSIGRPKGIYNKGQKIHSVGSGLSHFLNFVTNNAVEEWFARHPTVKK